MNRKPEFNRLVGQITSLRPNENKVLIVLIGACDIELVGRLRRQFEKQMDATVGPLIAAPTVGIVEIPESA